ncbi:MAG: hypothetical protein KDC35_18630 [Acidobacteria bacterium]|nr:hypothetical protein [Acidobacteriota bacterium]
MGIVLLSLIAQVEWSLAPSTEHAAIGEIVVVELRMTSDLEFAVVSMELDVDGGLRLIDVLPCGDFSIQAPFDGETPPFLLTFGNYRPGTSGHGLVVSQLIFLAEQMGPQTVSLTMPAAFEYGHPPQRYQASSKTLTIQVGTKQQTFATPIRLPGSFALVAGDGGLAGEMDEITPEGTLHRTSVVTCKPLEKCIWVPENESGWLVFRGTGVISSYGIYESQDGLELDMSPWVTTHATLTVPHVAQRREQFETFVYLGSALDQSGPPNIVAGESVIQIPIQSLASQRLDLNNWFTELPPWMEIQSGSFENGLVAVEQFRKHTAHQSVSMPLTGGLDKSLIFPHIANNLTQFWTGIVLVNTTALPNATSLEVYGHQQLMETISISLAPRERLTILYQMGPDGLPETVTVPPHNIQLDEGVSWLRVQGERLLAGYALFGDRSDRYLAGLQSAPTPFSELIYPLLWRDNRWTGFALINTSADVTPVEVTVLNVVGGSVAQFNIEIPGYGKVLATDSSFFDGQSLPSAADHVRIRQLEGSSLSGFLLLGDLGDRQLLAGMAAYPHD